MYNKIWDKESEGMKLNNKRTIYIGFAFFLICAFWQAYDTIIPKILTDKFGMSQSWSGAIMGLDNILALFMLPLCTVCLFIAFLVSPVLHPGSINMVSSSTR